MRASARASPLVVARRAAAYTRGMDEDEPGFEFLKYTAT